VKILILLEVLLLWLAINSTLAYDGEVSILGDRLTALWAQEYSGNDLVREELAKEHTLPVTLAVIDLGFEADHIQLSPGFENIHVPPQRNGRRTMRANHGTSVVNLLRGPDDIRVTDHAQLINLTAASASSMYAYMMRGFEKSGHYPRVVSNSLGWTSETISEVVEEADKKGVLWFLAAGNSFPLPVAKHEINSSALLIGSYAPSGLTSFESQNHKDMLILAPANEELLTLNGEGKRHLFGATSGATPIVAGTVINLLSVLPTLDKESVVTIIKTTAFPSVENKLGFKEMPGLLNGYLAHRVVLRLKKKCSTDIQCVKNELKSPAIFKFEILEDSKAKINCKEFKKTQSQEILKELRRLSFLKSSFHQREAACAYKSLAFAKNAQYFQFLAQNKLDLQSMEIHALKALKENIFQVSYYRYTPLYSEDFHEELLRSDLGDHHKDALGALTLENLRGLDP
jgi:predicted DNA-binding transcriptional regulator AlpA